MVTVQLTESGIDGQLSLLLSVTAAGGISVTVPVDLVATAILRAAATSLVIPAVPQSTANQSSEDVAANVPASASASPHPGPFSGLLNQLTRMQSDVDVNNDGQFDEFDTRILVRCIAGLRGQALGRDVDIVNLRRVMGLSSE